MTAGLFNKPSRSQVLRSLWRVKDDKAPRGTGNNVKPDFQQLLTNADLLVLCDGTEEGQKPTLEERVRQALQSPDLVDRFGGWCLGESTHLINDVHELTSLLEPAEVFLEGGAREVTLPVWVDHVGSAKTRYASGAFERCQTLPDRTRLPRIAA